MYSRSSPECETRRPPRGACLVQRIRQRYDTIEQILFELLNVSPPPLRCKFLQNPAYYESCLFPPPRAQSTPAPPARRPTVWAPDARGSPPGAGGGVGGAGGGGGSVLDPFWALPGPRDAPAAAVGRRRVRFRFEGNSAAGSGGRHPDPRNGLAWRCRPGKISGGKPGPRAKTPPEAPPDAVPSAPLPPRRPHSPPVSTRPTRQNEEAQQRLSSVVAYPLFRPFVGGGAGVVRPILSLDVPGVPFEAFPPV